MNYSWTLFHSIAVDMNEETVMCVNDGDDVRANYASTMPVRNPAVFGVKPMEIATRLVSSGVVPRT